MDFNELLKRTLEKQALDKVKTASGRGRGRPRGGGGAHKSGPSGIPKISGRGINLAMLMRDGLILPGKGVLKMDYFGNTFEADLMEDGQLKWSDTNLVFSSPSAWASHCKQLVNPEKKSGCGWTTVKYNGRKLEWYKTKWMRNQRMKMELSNNKAGDGLAIPGIGMPGIYASGVVPGALIKEDDHTDTADESEEEKMSHTSQESSDPSSSTAEHSATPGLSEEAKAASEPERPRSAPSQHQRPSSAPKTGTYSPSEKALLEKAGIDGLSLDIASLAAIFGASSGCEQTAFEKNILEKAQAEQAAVEAALAGQINLALQQKQQQENVERSQHEELRKQEELVRAHQKLQEEYIKQQEEILKRELHSREKQKKEHEKELLKAQQQADQVLAEQMILERSALESAALQQSLLGNAALQQNFIQNAIINQAVLEKAVKDHAASGQTDKIKQMLLEEAMRQQAAIIQAAMSQIAENLLIQAQAKQQEPEIMKEARQDALPAESTLIDCVKFSVVGQKQPYSVYITSNSLLLMDYHCHLSTDEVYGYLGGRWDPNSLTLHVTQVFPCSLHNPSDTVECTLIQNKIRELIIQQDLTVIGWYHSHPTSSPRPSQHDIVCQSVHQQHMRSLDGRIDPCLGVIVSPFRGQTPVSDIQAFCVMHTNEGTPVPMHLEYTCLWDNAVSPELATEMRAMSLLYAKQGTGVKFDMHWRNNISIFSKMTQSLKLKSPKDFRDEKFVEVMRQIVAKEA